MKKIILLFMFLFLFGCELSNNPSSKVSAYLDNYNVLSDEVLENIEVKSSNEGLNNENRNLYKNVLKREYETLKYDIKDVSINGNQAKVITKINVIDLYKSEEETLEYLASYSSEFEDESGLFNNDKFNNYRLKRMLDSNERVDYEVVFNLNKKNGEWILVEPGREDLEKIHGLYNYEKN